MKIIYIDKKNSIGDEIIVDFENPPIGFKFLIKAMNATRSKFGFKIYLPSIKTNPYLFRALWYRYFPESEFNPVCTSIHNYLVESYVRPKSKYTLDIDERIYNDIISKFKWLAGYQAEMVAFGAVRNRFIIGDDCGAGKTRESIGLVEYKKYIRNLIVCPINAIDSWVDEIAECLGKSEAEKILIVDGKNINNLDFTLSPKWVICSYEFLASSGSKKVSGKDNDFPYVDILKRFNFQFFISDESHKLQKSTSQRSKAFKKITAKKPLVFMTATPISKRPIDFYNLLKEVGSTVAGSKVIYGETYCNAKQTFYAWNDKGVNIEMLPDLYQKIQPVFARRLKDQLFEIPPKKYMVIKVQLTDTQKSKYNKAMLDYVESKRDDLKKAGVDVFSIAEKLKYLDNHNSMVFRKISAMKLSLIKAEFLLEKFEEVMDSGKKILIFTSFDETRKFLMEKLGSRMVQIFGGSSTKERSEAKRKMREEADTMGCVAQIRAGGESMTMNSAEYAFMIDLDEPIRAYIQAADRIHRRGQTKKVMIPFAFCPGTVDEYFIQEISSTMNIFNNIVNGQSSNLDFVEMARLA